MERYYINKLLQTKRYIGEKEMQEQASYLMAVLPDSHKKEVEDALKIIQKAKKYKSPFSLAPIKKDMQQNLDYNCTEVYNFYKEATVITNYGFGYITSYVYANDGYHAKHTNYYNRFPFEGTW